MDVRETLIRNEYYIAGSINNNVVVVTYPMDGRPKLRHFKYVIGDSDINGKEVVRYAIPVIILTQLYLCAILCDYNIDLIIYEVDDKETTSAEFLAEITEDYSDEEVQKAAILLMLIKEVDPFDLPSIREIAAKKGVEDGFEIIEGMVRKAGLV